MARLPGGVGYVTANPVTTVVLATLLSALLVGAVPRYGLRKAILDRPNDRGSHAIATPRGGGAGILAATLLMFAVAAPEQSAMDWRLLLAFLGVLPTAIVGWIDDQRGLAVASRLGAHVVSGPLLLPLALAPGYGSTVAVVLATGWIAATLSAINVVNFIDGIDELIGLQGVVFGLHLATLGAFSITGALLGTAMAGVRRIPPLELGPGTHLPRRRRLRSLGVLGMIGGILVWRAGESQVSSPCPNPLSIMGALTIMLPAAAGRAIGDLPDKRWR